MQRSTVPHPTFGRRRWMDSFATYVSGGAGMLLSSAAAAVLSPAVLTPGGCGQHVPKARLNDVVLSACAWHHKIPLVHTNLLLPEMARATVDVYRVGASVCEVGAVAAMHRVHPPYLAEWLDRDLVRAKYADWRVTPYEWAPAPVPQ